MEPTDRNSHPELPTLDYAAVEPASDPPRKWWPSVLSIFLALLSVSTFTCMCGYFDKLSFIGTLPACVLAIYGWITNKNMNLAWRGFLIAVVVLSFMVFLKNAGDVLWFGHEPLFSRR